MKKNLLLALNTLKVAVLVATLFFNGNPFFRYFSASEIPTGFLNGITDLKKEEKEIVAQEMISYFDQIKKNDYKPFLEGVLKDIKNTSDLDQELVKNVAQNAGIKDISLVDDAIVVTGQVSENEYYRVIVRDLDYSTGKATYIVSTSDKAFPSAVKKGNSFTNEASAAGGLLDMLMGVNPQTQPTAIAEQARIMSETKEERKKEEGARPRNGFITYAKGSKVTNKSLYKGGLGYGNSFADSYRHGYKVMNDGKGDTLVVVPPPVTASPTTVLKMELLKGLVTGGLGLATTGVTMALAGVSASSMGIGLGVVGGLLAAGAVAYGAYKGYQFYQSQKAKIADKEKYLDLFEKLNASCQDEKDYLIDHLANAEPTTRSKKNDGLYLPRSAALHYIINKGIPDVHYKNASWMSATKKNSFFANPFDEEDTLPYANQLLSLDRVFAFDPNVTEKEKDEVIGQEILKLVKDWPYGKIGDDEAVDKNVRLQNAEVSCMEKLDHKLAPDGAITSIRKTYKGVKNVVTSFAGGIMNFFSKLNPFASSSEEDAPKSQGYADGFRYATDEGKLRSACENYVRFQQCHLKVSEILKNPGAAGEYFKDKIMKKDDEIREESSYAKKLNKMRSSVKDI